MINQTKILPIFCCSEAMHLLSDPWNSHALDELVGWFANLVAVDDTIAATSTTAITNSVSSFNPPLYIDPSLLMGSTQEASSVVHDSQMTMDSQMTTDSQVTLDSQMTVADEHEGSDVEMTGPTSGGVASEEDIIVNDISINKENEDKNNQVKDVNVPLDTIQWVCAMRWVFLVKQQAKENPTS